MKSTVSLLLITVALLTLGSLCEAHFGHYRPPYQGGQGPVRVAGSCTTGDRPNIAPCWNCYCYDTNELYCKKLRGCVPTRPPTTTPSGTSPSGTSPSGTSPSGTSPSGTSPSGTSPSGTSPSGTSPATAVTGG